MTVTAIAIWFIAGILVGIFGALNRIAKTLRLIAQMQAASMSSIAAETFVAAKR